VGADERVLGDFFGVSAVAEQGEGEAVDFLAVALHDFGERGFVAGEEAADERRIVGGFGFGGGCALGRGLREAGG
jgi:hypothetical protein